MNQNYESLSDQENGFSSHVLVISPLQSSRPVAEPSQSSERRGHSPIMGQLLLSDISGWSGEVGTPLRLDELARLQLNLNNMRLSQLDLNSGEEVYSDPEDLIDDISFYLFDEDI